jgi:membrane protein DedA with SNARE-associated domain/rhodanese-related sulfurtransferase
MELPIHILMVYGYLLLAGWVLVEQLGLPLPAMPVLLAAGALSAEHELNFGLAFLVSLAAALTADITWFLVGRRYGHHVLRILCKLSLEPTICVRKTQDSFGRRRELTLVIAKFVPGLATLAPPVAGENGMGFGRFLLFDSMGASLWLLVLLGVGRFSGALLVLGIVGFFVYRLYRRRVFMNELVQARVEPADLKGQLDAGELVYIVDLRHPLELLPDPFTLPGAVHFSPDGLAERHTEIPRDRDIVLFCTCPSEATAAKTAMTLHKLGIERVRPLRGGYDEWKRLGYPLEAAKLPRLPLEPARAI